MRLELAATLLQDADERVRRTGAALLNEEESPESDALLIRALADSSDSVWQAARSSLIYRYPWLVLEPSFVRPVPESALTGSYGEAWVRLRRMIAKTLRDPALSQDLLDRLLTIPGVVPDIIEELEEAGRGQEAADLVDRRTVPAKDPRERQIMFAPTYRCNLACSYCYAKNFADGFPPDMTLDDLAYAISWLSAQGIGNIILGGGEPTVYLHLPELLQMAAERSIAVHLTSNCLYSAAVRKLVAGPPICELVAHYEQEQLGRSDSAVNLFAENLGAAREAGLSVMIRYTITDRSGPAEWRVMMDLARRLSIEQINYALAFQGSEGVNAHFRYQETISTEGGRLDALLAQFCADAATWGLRLHLSKPFPLCALKIESLRGMLKGETLRSACAVHRDGFTRNVTINPDLSTFPCNGIAIHGPKISELTSIDEAGRHYAATIRNLMTRPYNDACRDCALWYRGFCQGACLAEHYWMSRHEENHRDKHEQFERTATVTISGSSGGIVH